MWYYAFVLVLGFASLQIMVHQWHLSYISWVIFMLLAVVVLTFLRIKTVKEFGRRDKAFEEIKTLAASFLGERHIHHPTYDISPYELDNLIIGEFSSKQLFRSYYEYRFQRKYSPDVTALFMIMDAVAMLILTGNYHNISQGFDDLNEKGNYLYAMYNDACEELEALNLFSESDVDNYSNKLDAMIEDIGYKLLSKQ